LNIHRGMITNQAVADSLKQQFTPVAKALAT
jgi:alanine dehydrogenase